MKKAMFLFVFCLSALWLVAQSPEWQWANQAGGTGLDYGKGISTDSSGNSYVTGYFAGTATFGTTTLTSSGSGDIFIAKLGTYGNYLWAKQAGGTSNDYGKGIATDTNGNSYVSGSFTGTATFGTLTLASSSGGRANFIVKIDSAGNYQWAKQAGGNGTVDGIDISTDSSGNSYVTGIFYGNASYGTATFGTITLTSINGSYDIFVAKLDTYGNYLWAKQAGGDDFDTGLGIATDSSGNSYVTGIFNSFGTFGSTTLSSNSGDIFITKLDINGNFLWAKHAGNTGYGFINDIASDSSGNSYVTGYFGGTLTLGSTTLTSSESIDIFVAKLDTNGNFLWVKQAGGTSADEGKGIGTDSSGNSYVTGNISGIATFGNTILSCSGLSGEIFVTRLDTNGNWLWAVKAGGVSYDDGNSIAIDSSGNSYVTGYFSDIAIIGTTTLTCSGWYDIFVAKLSSSTMVSDEFGVPQPIFSLGQNHPNPFTNSTSFELEVSDAKSVYEVSVYDLRGRHICTLHQGLLPAGKQTFTWNGKDAADNELSSGVYFYRVSNGINSQVKKMIFIR